MQIWWLIVFKLNLRTVRFYNIGKTCNTYVWNVLFRHKMLTFKYNLCALLIINLMNKLITITRKIMFCSQANGMLFIRWHVCKLKDINDLKAFLFRSLWRNIVVIQIQDLMEIISIKYVIVIYFEKKLVLFETFAWWWNYK